MQRIRVEQAGPVKTVTLTRGEKRNAIDSLMLEELQACFATPPEAADRVVVLRAEAIILRRHGPGRTRSPGAGKGISPIEPVLHAMEAHPLPFVAVVHGDAIAGGNELALHCDLVVASRTARFGMSLAQIGLAPTWGLAKKLMDVAGPVATREILLLGDPLPASRFHELGLISHVADPDALEQVANSVIDRLARNAPLSLRAMKALLNRQTEFREHIPHADIDELVNAARASEDAEAGMRARLEKRQAEFKGC